MAYTALQLITNAYYLSQIVARELQTVSGTQINDGLLLLNDILVIKGTDKRLIPYYQRYTFNTIGGVEDYFIENLIAVDTLTFNLGVVRYSMQEMSRRDFFGSPRVDNIQSLPFSYREERELDGTRLYLYFVPDQVYVMKLSGKFGLTEVAINTDLTLTYDRYYIEYLRHELANYICSEWGQTLPDGVRAKYEEIRKKLMDVSPSDLSIQKLGYFRDGHRGALGWGQINIGKGWTRSY